MANQQYLKVKIAALESERVKKQAEIEALDARLAGYTEQLEPEPEPAAGKKADKKDDQS
jgi:hypothetical protein